MDSKRNIFLEAALSGRPVVAGPSYEIAEKTRTDSSTKSKPRSTKVKEDKNKELSLIKQAVDNVGRLPGKVLRYVELMAYNLSEVDKTYYSNVAKIGGPSRAAALKRVSRRIKAIDKKNAEPKAGSSTSSASKAINPEDVYESNSSDSEDLDKLYLYKPTEKSKPAKWLRDSHSKEKGRDLNVSDESDTNDQENTANEKRKKTQKSKNSKKAKFDNILEMLPEMMTSVKEAADAHKKAVKKWQQNISSDSD